MISAALRSHKSIHWATPKTLYDELNAEFAFDYDPCPLHSETEGVLPLFASWIGKRVFCNPPYGPEIADWLNHWRETELAVFLLPARTDTKWFHEIVLPDATEVRFLKGRLCFNDGGGSAPFPSMIVVFNGTVNAASPLIG